MRTSKKEKIIFLLTCTYINTTLFVSATIFLKKENMKYGEN